MTIEELIGNIIGTMTRHGWENIKTVNGDQNHTLGVLFNGSPNDLPFPTLGWNKSGIYPDPTNERQWAMTFTKNSQV